MNREVIGTLMLASFAVASLVTFLLVRFSWTHEKLTRDSAPGPQKFHAHSVSRIGGLGIFVAFAVMLVWDSQTRGYGWQTSVSGYNRAMLLLVCSLIAFAGGFAEDISKNVSVRTRLAATMLAAGVAYFALDGIPDRVGVAGLDFLLQFGVGSFLFALIAVAGIANAVNIVDGFNGLSGFLAVFILGAMAYVSFLVGDSFILDSCLILLGAILGFLVWNFPHGRIFLGDGGAYFVGFIIAELAVLLVHGHPQVSPWFPLMLVAYPVWETFYSIYRKKIIRGDSPGQPDGLHFHMLVYKRVVRWKVGSKDPGDMLVRNWLTSPHLWLLSLLTIIPAALFWDDTVVLAFLFFGFALLYNLLYNRIVTFHVPKWLIIHSPVARR